MGVARDFKGILGKRIWNFSFGENIGIAKFETPENSYEIDVQPAAFGMMDIASHPTKLVNTDYFIGLGVSKSKDNWQHLMCKPFILASPQAAAHSSNAHVHTVVTSLDGLDPKDPASGTSPSAPTP